MTMRFPVAAALAGTLFLTGCTDPSVATSDPNQRTKEGVLAGGVIGAVAGGIIGGDAQGAVIGGIVGAGVGGAVGYSLDKQAAELQRDFSDGRIQIINNGSSLTVRMPQDILFATDSAVVNPTLQADLRVLANSLQRYPDSTVQVVGHTDNTGTASYNQNLSVRRANSVSAVLIQSGVPAGRISAFGQGEDAPIASNLTAEGRAKNRRVDITIIPTQRG